MLFPCRKYVAKVTEERGRACERAPPTPGLLLQMLELAAPPCQHPPPLPIAIVWHSAFESSKCQDSWGLFLSSVSIYFSAGVSESRGKRKSGISPPVLAAPRRSDCHTSEASFSTSRSPLFRSASWIRWSGVFTHSLEFTSVTWL